MKNCFICWSHWFIMIKKWRKKWRKKLRKKLRKKWRKKPSAKKTIKNKRFLHQNRNFTQKPPRTRPKMHSSLSIYRIQIPHIMHLLSSLVGFFFKIRTLLRNDVCICNVKLCLTAEILWVIVKICDNKKCSP